MKYLVHIMGCICFAAIFPSVGSAVEGQDASRWEKNVSKASSRFQWEFAAEYIQEFEAYIDTIDTDFETSWHVDDRKAELFVEFEISDNEQFAEGEEILIPNTVGVAWKWGLTNLTLSSGTQQLTQDSIVPKPQFDLPLGEKHQEVYVASAEWSGEIANVDVYTEFGIAGGEVDTFEEEFLTAEELDEAMDVDLSGYYVNSGANVGLGHWTIGVEAGYGGRENSANAPSAPAMNTLGTTQLIGSIALQEEQASGATPVKNLPLPL